MVVNGERGREGERRREEKKETKPKSANLVPCYFELREGV